MPTDRVYRFTPSPSVWDSLMMLAIFGGFVAWRAARTDDPLDRGSMVFYTFFGSLVGWFLMTYWTRAFRRRNARVTFVQGSRTVRLEGLPRPGFLYSPIMRRPIELPLAAIREVDRSEWLGRGRGRTLDRFTLKTTEGDFIIDEHVKGWLQLLVVFRTISSLTPPAERPWYHDVEVPFGHWLFIGCLLVAYGSLAYFLYTTLWHG